MYITNNHTCLTFWSYNLKDKVKKLKSGRIQESSALCLGDVGTLTTGLHGEKMVLSNFEFVWLGEWQVRASPH